MHGDGSFIIILGLFAILAIGGWLFAAWQAKKRREAMIALSSRLGLSYSPHKNYGLADRYEFLNKLCQGHNRYAYNVLHGKYQDQDVLVFDYHYETHSRDSKGHRRTHHHYFSFFILLLPRSFPELTIVAEGFLSKVAQAFGYDDIDFESAEFSRKFCVRSSEKKFAYDICHPRMMEWLLANPDLSIEIERQCLSLFFSRRLAVDQILFNLDRLVEIRRQLPEYLWTQQQL